MSYTTFRAYGDLLEEILNKLGSLHPTSWTKNESKGVVWYYTRIDDNSQISMFRKEKYFGNKETHYNYSLEISMGHDVLNFDDKGIITNHPSIEALRSFFHDVESKFKEKPVDKNRELLEVLLKKLK